MAVQAGSRSRTWQRDGISARKLPRIVVVVLAIVFAVLCYTNMKEKTNLVQNRSYFVISKTTVVGRGNNDPSNPSLLDRTKSLNVILHHPILL